MQRKANEHGKRKRGSARKDCNISSIVVAQLLKKACRQLYAALYSLLVSGYARKTRASTAPHRSEIFLAVLPILLPAFTREWWQQQKQFAFIRYE